MKKRIFALLMMLMAVVFAVSVGAIDDGKLETADDIKELMDSTDATVLGGTYELMADIDLSSVTGQSPIGDKDTPFTGTFNGNGYIITGVNISVTETYTGFFGVLAGNATVRDLTLYGTVEDTNTAKDKNYGVGGFAGAAGFATGTVTLENCVNYCDVTGPKYDPGRAGGIVGLIAANGSKTYTQDVNVTIRNCTNYGTIQSQKHAGGIAGRIADVGSTAASAIYSTNNVVDGTYTISGCSNYGTISTRSVAADGAGGIVAVALTRNSKLIIEKCYNEGSVTGGQRIGGILGSICLYSSGYDADSDGENDNGLVIDTCVNMGKVTANGNYTSKAPTAASIGGILGSTYGAKAHSLVDLKNCFNGGELATVEALAAECGAIYGEDVAEHDSISNCTCEGFKLAGNAYSAATTYPSGSHKNGGTAIAEADLGTASKYPASFADVFTFTSTGPVAHTHLISLNAQNKCVCSFCGVELLNVATDGYIELSKTADVLLLMANSKVRNTTALGYNYRLTSDINLFELDGQSPIGTTKAPFTGSFDGNAKTISGLKVGTASTTHNALFGVVGSSANTSAKPAKIENLTVSGTVTSSTHTAGIIAEVYGTATFTDLTSAVTVNGKAGCVGGVIGSIHYSKQDGMEVTVDNCKNTGKVTGTRYVGGVVGYAIEFDGEDKLTVQNCQNTGELIKATSTDTGYYGAAGIVGYLSMNTSGSGGIVEILNCTNSGDVQSSCVGAGGILGYLYTRSTESNTDVEVTVSNCSNSGDITAADKAGGVIGAFVIYGADAEITLDTLYNEGTVKGPQTEDPGDPEDCAAGIIAYLYTNGNAAVSNLWNNGEVNAYNRVGGIIGYQQNRTKDTTKQVFTNLLNTGKLSVNKNADKIYFGGIVAYSANNYPASFENVYSAGAMSVPSGYTPTQYICSVISVPNQTVWTNSHYDFSIVGYESRSEARGVKVTTSTVLGDLYNFYNGWYIDKATNQPRIMAFHTHSYVNDVCSVCGWEKCVGTNHCAMAWDLSGTTAVYKCVACADSELDLSGYDGIYVSDNGNDLGNSGLTKDKPLKSYTKAFDIAAKLGKDVKICIVDTVTVESRTYSTADNTITAAFEESPHTYTITVTSADAQNKGVLKIPSDVTYYFMYGPVIFDDVKMVGTKANGGIRLYARGFDLTMGEGFEVADIQGKASYSPNNSDFGLANEVEISDTRLYVNGGFHYGKTETAIGSYAGAEPAKDLSANMTILGGEYYAIVGGNYFMDTGENPYVPVEGAEISIMVGDVTVYYLAPFALNKTATVHDAKIDMHYVGKIDAGNIYRFLFGGDGETCSGNIVNHFFHKGFDGSAVGEYPMASKKAEVAVNCYYATGMSKNELIEKFCAKSDYYAGKQYLQDGETMSFVEWCALRGGGHQFENDVCAFCEITKCNGTDHYYSWDVSAKTATCVAGCPDISVPLGTALYVSDTGKEGALGTSSDAPLNSYTLAQTLAAASGSEFTIYLKGTVTLRRMYHSAANTVYACFEEAPHTELITVTSSGSKATLKIPSYVNNYFLYGPVTFRNVKISGDTAGSTDSASANVRFFARGFTLTMDTGITMQNVGGSDITVAKTDAGIDGFGATVTIPDSKVSVFGGFLWNGAYDAGEDTFNTFSSELVINSGEYWAIVGGNYSTSAAAARAIDGADIHVTVGKVEARYISPVVLNSAATVDNTTAEMHYTAKVTAAQVYRFAFGEDATGSGNVIKHFFDKGAAASAVGDFGMGSTLAQAQVNMYYADALKADQLIIGYQTKDQKFAEGYSQTSEILPYSEYCVKYRGGHTLDANGVCTFCEVTPCATHSLAWKVTQAATCGAEGVEAYACTVCAVIDQTRPIEKTADHDAVWIYDTVNGTAEYTCSVCLTVLETKTLSSYTVTDGALHVSATGSANATGTENDPINDFGLAMQIAAQQGTTPVTIYVHDSITIYKNGDSDKLIDYVEPKHDNKITITSYGNTKAVLRFDESRYVQTMSYNLSGDTEFNNIELSAWRSTKAMWIVARHYELTMGEGITIDYQRRGTTDHASYVYLVGGCYGVGNSKATTGSKCDVGTSPVTTADTNLTIKSGTYASIYGGTYNGKCCGTGDIINLSLLGDITTRGAIVAGNNGNNTYNGDSGTINITINGHISVGTYFAFSSAGSNTKTAKAYTSEQVTLTLLGGSIITENFRRQSGVMPLRVLGATAEGELTTSRIDIDGSLGVNALTIIVDKSSDTAVQLYEHLYYSSLTADPSQNVVNGSTPVEEEEESEGEDAGTDEDDPAGDDETSGTTTAITTNADRYTRIDLEELCESTNSTHVRDNSIGALQGTDANGKPYTNIPATCLVNGLQAYQCVNCSEVYYETVTAAGHVLNTTPDGTAAATCNAPAMEKYICQTAGCGAIVYKVAVENGQESTPLDGTLYAHHSDPEKTGTCQICGKDLTVLCDHKNASTDTTETAKTTAPITSGCATGTRTICTKCGLVELNLTSTGDGHNYGKYTVTKEPTATEAGIKTRTCKGCGKVDTALINASGDAINAGALALNADGDLAGFDVESSKLSRVEKAALNALLQENAYGSEIKISYETDGVSVTGITYNIPVPAEYTEYKNVMVVVKDDDGTLHFVDFKIEKGYIVFTF